VWASAYLLHSNSGGIAVLLMEGVGSGIVDGLAVDVHVVWVSFVCWGGLGAALLPQAGQ
jgi:hypothetical protein